MQLSGSSEAFDLVPADLPVVTQLAPMEGRARGLPSCRPWWHVRDQFGVAAFTAAAQRQLQLGGTGGVAGRSTRHGEDRLAA
jgi:hypothetical protein